MKRNLDIRLYFLPLFLMMAALMSACKKNNEGSSTPPTITSVRMYRGPGIDTLLSTGKPTDPNLSGGTGSYVVIIGQNLKNATEIDFDGVSASFNPALFASNSAVVQIPNIVFSQIDTAKLYTITYKTPAGSTTFSFKLGPPPPAIYAISNVFANPGDSVYLFGANLLLVQKFVYGGIPITNFKTTLYGDSLGFVMPGSALTNKLITLTTKSGTVIDTIKATPIITGVSNENPSPGDSVYIYGTYFKNIQSITFAGTPVTTFTASNDAKSVGFIAPALTQSGPVSITTGYGTGTTPYNVYTPTYLKNGVIENMDGSGVNYVDYGGNAQGWGDGIGGVDAHINNRYGWFNETTAFNGVLGSDHTLFIFVNTGVLSGGSSNTGIILASNQWVPAANLTDAPSSWALKMEISVPTGWNGGALDIKTNVAGYIYRWEPWKTGTAYKTKGWITITIPLSSFRASDPALGEGMGAALTDIQDLVGPTGQTGAYIYRDNYDTATTTTGFYCAYDNIRVVKIK